MAPVFAAPTFFCDEMLHGLARWLRAAGYDTAMAERGQGDRAVLARSVAEGRLLLTCDRALAQRRAAEGQVVVLAGRHLDAWVAELSRRLCVDWGLAPFTRCLVCNHALAPAPPSVTAGVPAGACGLAPLTWCPQCARVYWPGGHVRRMAARLARWRAEAARKGEQDAQT
ncbi:MAG: Mut7-C RNAse domain-containing protein [Actinomycetota bacterium]